MNPGGVALQAQPPSSVEQVWAHLAVQVLMPIFVQPSARMAVQLSMQVVAQLWGQMGAQLSAELPLQLLASPVAHLPRQRALVAVQEQPYQSLMRSVGRMTERHFE